MTEQQTETANINNEREIELIEDEEMWVWKNGLCCAMKCRTEVLSEKVAKLSSSIEGVLGGSTYLRDMLELNTEVTGYLGSLRDNRINIRDLFDFLTICFYEYEHFFKENRQNIFRNREERTILLPLAHDILYNDIKKILDFISNNTLNYPI